MAIKLSTIIPIYNKEKALRETLQSIVDNHGISDDEYECILVDDESTDGCPEICREFCEKYPYFNYIRIFNDKFFGPSKARNVGLRYCKGDLIHFLDADDLLCDGFYQHAVEILDNSDYDAYVGDSYFIKDGMWYTYHLIEFESGIFGPLLSCCVFKKYIKDILFYNVMTEDIIFTWMALNNRKYYRDNHYYDTYVYRKEYNEVVTVKHEGTLDFPFNVVRFLERFDDYKFKVVDNQIVKK